MPVEAGPGPIRHGWAARRRNMPHVAPYGTNGIASSRLHAEHIHASGTSRQHIGNQYQNTTNNYAAVMPGSNVPVKPSDDPIHLDFIRACQQGQSPQRLNHLLGRGADIDHRDEKQRTPLHHAASSGSVITVSHLIDAGADVHIFVNSVGTPLHSAAASGSVWSVKHLLDAGADPNASDDWIGTPIHHAAFTGSADTARCLLDNGADANACGRWVGSPLSIAAVRGHLAVAKVLLEHGADGNGDCGYFGSAAQMACAAGSVAILQLLQPEAIDKFSTSCYAIYHRFLDAGSRAFPSALGPCAMEEQELYDCCPVVLAIRHGHVEAAHLCLTSALHAPREVDYEVTWYTEDEWRNPSDRTCSAVDFAINTLDIDMLRLLSNQGLIPSDRFWLGYAMNCLGSRAINKATRDGTHASACISLLLQHGVIDRCLYTEEEGDDTLLMDVMRRKIDDLSYQTAKAILEHGAPVNAVNKRGQTALMIAAGTNRTSRVRCVELLCEFGADVNLQDKDGRTALRYAQKWGGAEDFAEVKRILHYAGRAQRDGPRSSSGEQPSLS